MIKVSIMVFGLSEVELEVHEIPRIGDIITVIMEDKHKREYEVQMIKHLCDLTTGIHLIGVNCRRSF